MSIIATLAGASIAIGAATRGHVAPPQAQAPTQRGVSAVCMYQIPGQMLWVNLYLTESITVRDVYGAHQVGKRYETTIRTASRMAYEIDMPVGMHISTYSEAILKRLRECAEGQ